jgi:hypothetical protein
MPIISSDVRDIDSDIELEQNKLQTINIVAGRLIVAPIAQLVEQLPLKETVPGSIPGGGTKQ